MVVVTVRALLVNAAGKLLLVRRSQTDPRHPGAWDLPGGQVETGERIETALLREVHEEVGFILVNPLLVYAISGPRPEGSGSWLFFVEHVGAVDPALSNEHDAFEWVDPKEFLQRTAYDVLGQMYDYVSTHDLLGKDLRMDRNRG